MGEDKERKANLYKRSERTIASKMLGLTSEECPALSRCALRNAKIGCCPLVRGADRTIRLSAFGSRYHNNVALRRNNLIALSLFKDA